MRRAVLLVAIGSLVLALAACGSSDPKAEILDGVRAAAIENGLTEVQAACIVDGLRELTVDQLNAIGNDAADATTTQAYTMVAAQCLLSG